MLMKVQPRHAAMPRRHPMPDLSSEWNADKGRKHEAFDTALPWGRRLDLVTRMDRKR